MLEQTAKKVLVIEDEPAMARVLSDELAREGFWVFEAKNGEEGLWVALLERPDLILLDILMPRKDGLRMLKELRRDDWGREVPVIILTNLNDGEKIAEALRNGAYDFFVKSDCKLENVISRVKQRLLVSEKD